MQTSRLGNRAMTPTPMKQSSKVATLSPDAVQGAKESKTQVKSYSAAAAAMA